jgi:hypothetical protein
MKKSLLRLGGTFQSLFFSISFQKNAKRVILGCPTVYVRRTKDNRHLMRN